MTEEQAAAYEKFLGMRREVEPLEVDLGGRMTLKMMVPRKIAHVLANCPVCNAEAETFACGLAPKVQFVCPKCGYVWRRSIPDVKER